MTELGADGMNGNGQVGMKYMMRGMSLFMVVIAAKLPAVGMAGPFELGAVLLLDGELDPGVPPDARDRPGGAEAAAQLVPLGPRQGRGAPAAGHRQARQWSCERSLERSCEWSCERNYEWSCEWSCERSCERNYEWSCERNCEWSYERSLERSLERSQGVGWSEGGEERGEGGGSGERGARERAAREMACLLETERKEKRIKSIDDG